MTAGELAFYRVLRGALGRRFAISIKTRLADVLECPENLWNAPEGRRLSQKHVDFVLYDRWTAQVIAAIELDDRSHETPERRRRDRFLDDAFLSAGATLIRYKAAWRYDLAEVRDHFNSKLEVVSERAVTRKSRAPFTRTARREPSLNSRKTGAPPT